jgi:hypothetical protein
MADVAVSDPVFSQDEDNLSDTERYACGGSLLLQNTESDNHILLDLN